MLANSQRPAPLVFVGRTPLPHRASERPPTRYIHRGGRGASPLLGDGRWPVPHGIGGRVLPFAITTCSPAMTATPLAHPASSAPQDRARRRAWRASRPTPGLPVMREAARSLRARRREVGRADRGTFRRHPSAAREWRRGTERALVAICPGARAIAFASLKRIPLRAWTQVAESRACPGERHLATQAQSLASLRRRRPGARRVWSPVSAPSVMPILGIGR